MSSAIVRQGTALTMVLLVVMATSWSLPATTEARQVRNNTRTNVNRNVNANRNARQVRDTTRTNVNRNVNRNRNVNANRNRNVNVNRNVNIHRDIDIDVDHDYHGYHGHGIGTAVAVAAAATATAAIVGSIVYSLPPACSAVVVNGLTYQQCGGTWYQPQYAGTQVTYVVVDPQY